MSENTTFSASLNSQKPAALILVNGDFLARQFREYQEYFAEWYGERTMYTPRGVGIPASLDPLFMRHNLCKEAYSDEDRSILVLFQQKAELDFFDPEPEQAFKIVQCSSSIKREMRKVIAQYTQIRRVLFVGEREDARTLDKSLGKTHQCMQPILSFEEEEQMQSELDALELLFSVDDIDQEDAIMSDARFDYGRPCKHNSITAWIMGFIDEYISYHHECDYPT